MSTRRPARCAAWRRLIIALAKAASPPRRPPETPRASRTGRRPRRRRRRRCTLPPMTMASQRAIATCRSVHRHQVTDQRHADREDAARRHAADDAGGEQHGKAGGERADDAGGDDDDEADHHQPHLADDVGDRPQDRLHQSEWQREGRRQQGDACRIDVPDSSAMGGTIGSTARVDSAEAKPIRLRCVMKRVWDGGAPAGGMVG